MIKTKKILMSIGNSEANREMSKDELHGLQNHLMKMYRDIEAVCEKHQLKLCLAFGNVLGAVRHKGWIPWDDDLDIHMPREDYDKFLSVFYKELPDRYKVSSYKTAKGSYARFAKVFDRETLYIPLTGERTEHSHVFVDIFPLDYVSTNVLINKIKRLWAFFMMYTASSVMQVESKSEKYKKMMYKSSEGKFNWIFRQLWGMAFMWKKSSTWHRDIENFGKNKKSKFFHIISDIDLCYKKIPEEILFPFRKTSVEGIGEVWLPNNNEQYLSMIYGNWQKIPEDQDKWHHYMTELYIPKN